MCDTGCAFVGGGVLRTSLSASCAWGGGTVWIGRMQVGILDAVALVSYNWGLGLADTSIVIAATSLFAVVTLLWGVGK
ncbi:hypothetical protein GCM10008018_39100 [Paenibacillus marchantiophytorum]|uniref:Uncharacterized protein n=1 Tax=Paenibacillus marchantiophytorum TaxID=1619310 RepID=A0ABQ1EVC0_9BACL|nr:hypothetical protein [Paenibacillus marchantiophytorum]GFZ89074.1 hypothetical protein GCM10008018_39100 [Paenibacillus marchantiophytorum]